MKTLEIFLRKCLFYCLVFAPTLHAMEGSEAMNPEDNSAVTSGAGAGAGTGRGETPTFLFDAGKFTCRDSAMLSDFDSETYGFSSTAVTILDCSNNSLRKLTKEVLSQFKNLHTVILHNNPELRVENNAFSGLPNLTTIDLSDCGLRELPDDCFANCPQLQRLVLKGNRLNTLPASLAACKRLQELDLAENAFTQLPNLQPLHALETLDLTNNQLTTLPPDRLPLGDRDLLTSIACQYNRFGRLPLAFIKACLARGMALDLSNNACWLAPETNKELADLQEARPDVFVAMYDGDGSIVLHGDRRYANEVHRQLLSDTQDKYLSYVDKTHKEPVFIAIERLFRNKVSLQCIHTLWWELRNFASEHPLIIVGGGTILGCAAIGCVGAVAVGMTAGKVITSTVAGALVGTGVVIKKRNDELKPSSRPHFTCVEPSVEASTATKRLYTECGFVVSLVATLRQYLSAWSTYLYWLEHPTETIGDADALIEMEQQLLDALRISSEHAQTLRCRSEGDFLMLLNQLLPSDSYAVARSYGPRGLYTARWLPEQQVDAALPTGSNLARVLNSLRDAIISFGLSAHRLRAALHSRYICKHVGLGFVQTLCGEPSILALSLQDVSNTLTPLIKELIRTHGNAERAQKHPWFRELISLRRQVSDARTTLTRLGASPVLLG